MTGLRPCGSIPDPIQYVVSESVVKVAVDTVTDGGGNETLRSDRDDIRLHFVEPEDTVRYQTSIEFLRTDPGIFSLITGVPLVFNAAGDAVGFDAETRLPAKAFALEVWTRLNATRVVSRSGGFGTGGFGMGGFGVGNGSTVSLDGCARDYGYTVFPFLRGGMLGGFSFSNGLVNFTVKNAATRKGTRWGAGPYLIQDGERLFEDVSGNLGFRNIITNTPPPEQTNGIVVFEDVIDDGFANAAHTDEVDDGSSAQVADVTLDDGNAA